MSAPIFSRKLGIKDPVVTLTLTPVNFTYELAGATLVEFRYRKKPAGDVETVGCAIVDAANKQVALTLTDDVVDTLGKFECQVKVVTASGATYMFPNKGFDKFEITPNF